MQLIIFAIVTVIVCVAVEYLTRGLPHPWRWVILAALAVGLVLWFFNVVGLLTF